MDTNAIITLINSVGFPIVVCGFMAYYIYKIQTKTNDIISENTKVLTELVTLIKNFLKKDDDKEE